MLNSAIYRRSRERCALTDMRPIGRTHLGLSLHTEDLSSARTKGLLETLEERYWYNFSPRKGSETTAAFQLTHSALKEHETTERPEDGQYSEVSLQHETAAVKVRAQEGH